NEVPVQPADLHGVAVLATEFASARAPDEPGKDPDPDDHVRCVDAGQDEVKAHEHLEVRANAAPDGLGLQRAVMRLFLVDDVLDLLRPELRMKEAPGDQAFAVI